MPICSYPGCKEFAAPKSDRCRDHQIRNKAEAKAESAQLKKMQLAEAAARKNEEERLARNAKAKVVQERQARQQELRSEVIRRHRQTWNAQIDAIVSQVALLRQTNPNANAGSNPEGTTLGGTNNPLALSLSGATHGVSKGDILPTMSGFDSSDSGLYKFRRNGVLVHCS